MSLSEGQWRVFLRGNIPKRLRRFIQANHEVVRWPQALVRCNIDHRDHRLGGEPIFLPDSNKKAPRAIYSVYIAPDVAAELEDPILDRYQPIATDSHSLKEHVKEIAKYILTGQCGLSGKLELNWEDIFKAGYRVINYPASLPFPWQARMFEGDSFESMDAAISIIRQFAHENPLHRLGVINRKHDQSPQPFFSRVRDSSGARFAWSCLFFNRPLPEPKACHKGAPCNLCIDKLRPNRRGLRYIQLPDSQMREHTNSQEGEAEHERNPDKQSRHLEGPSRVRHEKLDTSGPHLPPTSEITAGRKRVSFDVNHAIGDPEPQFISTLQTTSQEHDRQAFVEKFKARRQAQREREATANIAADLESEKRKYQAKIRETEEEARRQVAEYRKKLEQAETVKLEQLRQLELKRKRMEEEDEKEAEKRFELKRKKDIADRLRKQLEEAEKGITILELELSMDDSNVVTHKTEDGLPFIIDCRDPNRSR